MRPLRRNLRACARMLPALVAGALAFAPAAVAAGDDVLHADDFAGGQEQPADSGVAAPTAVVTGMVAPGPRDVAVVLLNFASAPTEPFTEDAVRSAIFTGAASVDAFMREQSFGAIALRGKLRPDGDVFGWYTIAADPGVCDPATWRTQALAAAATAGASITGYHHVVYLFPGVGSCGWAGMADVRGARSYINGTLSRRVIAHELGHNLGAHHASALSCVDGAGTRVTLSGSCTYAEYGDPFDVMGGTGRHSHAVNKLRFGFIPPGNELTVTRTGTYPLAPSSAAAAATQSIRIPRGPGRDPLHLEIRRQAGAFDTFSLSDPAVTGVTLRLVPDSAVGQRSLLLDTTPATATFNDAPLGVGASFTDPQTGIAVTTQSVLGGVAQVAVGFPGDPGDPPPAAPAPATPPAGAVVPTPPVGAVRAVITARRSGARLAVIRLAAPAGSARRCAVRVGTGRWSACAIRAGRVQIARAAPRRARVRVALRLDGATVVSRVVPVPARGIHRVAVAFAAPAR